MKYQSNIDQFHTYLNTVLSELLESQIRTRSFFTELLEYEGNALADNSKKLSGKLQREWLALSHSNAQLVKLGTSSWGRSIEQIKTLLAECDQLIRQLHRAMIDRELYEQQGVVLQGIILSHEKIENWEEFVQSILKQFHNIFEFNFFSIAFETQNGIDLYLYYMGDFPEEVTSRARKELTEHMSSHLSQANELTIREYQVLDIELDHIDFSQMNSVTVDVDGGQQKLGGLLEMGYFSSNPLGIDEKSIIKSILSVMVMVIGSSRTLKKTLTELEYHASQEPLTGLYNRRFFNGALEQEIERSKRYDHNFCLLMLDLDNFKGINDSYGHVCGDTVLKGIANILKNQTRRGDIITRLGGDEFSILLPETDVKGARHVAEEIKMAIEKANFSDQHKFHVTTSIGLVAYPIHTTMMSALLSHVDEALYQAKAAGRNMVFEFNENMGEAKKARRLFNLSQDLSCAIKKQRIIPYFQPIVTTSGQSIFAYEALARLVNEDGSVTSAGKFIDAAEQVGNSSDFDKYMIQMITDKLLVDHHGLEQFPLVFINLSPVSVQKRGILQYAASVCNDKQIPPERIVFEITERDVVSDMSAMKNFLSELRNQGFGFALDDFGSGYNSFYYLRELYFEYVKIDGEFVRNMLNNKVDLALIEALYSLCDKLKMKTIAEYIESDQILTRVKEVGIDYCQGYFIGVPNAEISDMKQSFSRIN